MLAATAAILWSWMATSRMRAEVILGVDDMAAFEQQIVLWLSERSGYEQRQREKSHTVQRTA